MKTIEVFDPAMCCSTGVCGPSVDPALARFAGDADWLAAQGAAIERFNLAQQPGAFAEREVVRNALQSKGESCLPLILADGAIVHEGSYPARAELAALAGVDVPQFAYTAQVDELVAIAAAVASNCEPCLEYHVGLARDLGIADEEIAQAVKTARKVKETPARSILKTADELLGLHPSSAPRTLLPVVGPNDACCSGDTTQPGSASCC